MYNSYRAGSVGRHEPTSSTTTSYRSALNTSTPSSSSSSRFSRAASYDPYSTAASYSRPSRMDTSSYTSRAGVSSSLTHSDYAPRPYTTRFGSTDRLSSSMTSSSTLSRRPPTYPSSTSTSSAMSRSYGNPSTTSYSSYSASRDYTPSRTFSSTTGTRDYGGISSYRSAASTGGAGYGGISSYSSRPPYTPSYTSSSSTSASSYTPRVRMNEYRSKTPGFSTDYTPSSTGRRDRDYRSVSRFERATPTRGETPSREKINDIRPSIQLPPKVPMARESITKPEPVTKEDDVDRTFQTLYNRYVRDASSSSLSSVDEPKIIRKTSVTIPRKFISHSEAEEDTEEEESPEEIDFAPLSPRIRSSLSTADDRTPMCSPSKELTPVVSPVPKQSATTLSPAKKEVSATTKVPEPAKMTPAKPTSTTQKVLAKTPEPEKAKTPECPVNSFKEKFQDLNMQPVVIPKRDLKPASSQMDRLLKNEKAIDAIERKSISRDSTPKADTSPSPAKQPSPIPTSKVPSSPILKTSVSTTKPPIPTVTKTVPKATVTKDASPAPKATDIKKEASPTPKATVIKKEASPSPKPTLSKEASPAPKSTVVKREASPAPKSLVSKEPSPAPKLTKEASPAPKAPMLKKEASSVPKPALSKEASPAPKTTVIKKEASPSPKAAISKEASPAPKSAVVKREASPAPKSLVSRESSPAPKVALTKEASPAPKAAIVKKEASPAPKPVLSKEASPAPKAVVKKEASPAPGASLLKKEASPTPKAVPTVTVTKDASTAATKEATPKPTASKESSPSPAKTVTKREPSPGPKITKREPSPGPKITKREPSPGPKITKREPSPGPKITKREPSPGPKRERREPSASPKPERKRDRSRSRSREPSVGVTIVLGGTEPKTAVDKVKKEDSTREGSPSLLSVPARSSRRSPDGTMESSGDSATSSVASKRKDRAARTIDALKSKLDVHKRREGSEGDDDLSPLRDSSPRPPLLLVTQPSLPSTPRASVSGGYQWEDARSDGTDEDEEEEVDSDTEFCVSETFRIDQPKVNLGIINSARSSKSPFSDFDSDIDMNVFLATPGNRRESRGRVSAGAALPAPLPPIFTASVTFDGQEDVWDSAREDDDDDYRAGSTMGVYLSPAEFSSDESLDGDHYHDSVAVGCTLTLCQKAALRDTDDESDSEFYDSDEYSDEEHWDEDEEEEEDEEEYGSEYYEDEEEEEDVSRWSEPPSERSPSPRVKPLEAQFSIDHVEFEEVEGDMDTSVSLSLSKATTKRILKDGQSERPDVSVVAQSVCPREELLEQETTSELKPDEIPTKNALMTQSSPIAARKNVKVEPTYVKPLEEKITSEEASRLAVTNKKATDFAKKSVIQPPKLAKAEVQKVETKIGVEKPKPTPVPEPATTASKPPPPSTMTTSKPTAAPAAPVATAASKVVPAATAATTKVPETPAVKKELEDKSAVRKSALNMSAEEAKKKELADKEAATAKARRLGTVSSMADRFKTEAPKEPEITYKRSSRLTQRDEERPRKKYEIVKPVINDEFDKQVAELRNKMKSGTTNLQREYMELNKGILNQTEEAKLRELEEKHKSLLDKTTGVFGKADEEKERWKKQRDEEAQKEMAKIEMERRRGRTPVPEEKKKDELKPEVRPEPKRTVRKINRDKSPTPAPPTAAPAPGAPGAPASAGAPLNAATPVAGKTTSVPAPPPAPGAAGAPGAPGSKVAEKKDEAKTTPKPLRKTMVTKPTVLQTGPMKMPENKIEVNDNNADLFAAVAIVATKRKKSIVEMKMAKEEAKKERLQALREGKTINQIVPPQGGGAAATKIRNAQAKADDLSQASSDKSGNKRYAARRKTQELVNPSMICDQPKAKRRRRQTRRRFIRNPHDIDIILGWDKENSFEQLERKFMAAQNDKIKPFIVADKNSAMRKRKRPINTKIWISELTDIDKIYKTSELRDITASVG